MNMHPSNSAHAIDDALSIRDGRLFIESCDVNSLAERFGTPLYVTSEDQIRRNLTRIKIAFSALWPGQVRILPSVKANASLAVWHVLSQEDTGCDAFGPAELEVALRAGIPAELISLNGPTKSVELLERAIRHGVRVTIDSIDELARTVTAARRAGARAKVRLRLRPNYTSLQEPSELMPEQGSIHRAAAIYKAGIPTEALLAISAEVLQQPELDITGLMVHLGRHHSAPDTWGGMADACVRAVGEIVAAFPHLNVREIDLGGGFPTPRDPFGRAGDPAPSDRLRPRVPPIEAYAKAIAPRVAAGLRALGIEPEKVVLEVEPGRSLFADCGIHLTTVLGVKRETNPFRHTWVETDTSDAWLADAILERNRWTTIVAARAEETTRDLAQIVGTTCAPDVIVADEPIPHVDVGDVIAVLDTGAYQEVSASNFNSLPRPATVLVHEGEAEVIRRAETLADVLARELIPSRLNSGGDHDGGAPVRVTALDHVSVTTGDMDKSLRFYRDLLGLRVREQGEEDDTEIQDITGMRAARIRFADLHLPPRHVLELLQYVSPAGKRVVRSDNDPGATHISLQVDDIDAAHSRLLAAGVPVRSTPVTLNGSQNWSGARCFYATDPDGVTVELIEWTR